MNIVDLIMVRVLYVAIIQNINSHSIHVITQHGFTLFKFLIPNITHDIL